ncbi:unnamed protein product [Auanema sp. JU1783]|nr:unnamed protein product [Auanema sp. JU1783]
MRSFKGEPLSVNRLRQNEQTNDVILRRPLMEPSTSSEFCEHLPVPSKLNGKTSNGNVGEPNGYQQYNPRFSDCTETYPPPPSEYIQTNAQSGEGEKVLMFHGIQDENGGGGGEETDIDDEIAQSFSKNSASYLVPSKSQVLFFLSNSGNFKIQHTGYEMQITDSADFPLLDVWAEHVCCSSPVWIVESYGRRVLMLSENRPPFNICSIFPPFISSIFGYRRRISNSLSVADWNGDVIGFFLPGDPFLIQNNMRATIARCSRTEQQGENWKCVLEANGREIARIESGRVRIAADVSFQLKLLTLTALARAIGRPRPHNSCFQFSR